MDFSYVNSGIGSSTVSNTMTNSALTPNPSSANNIAGAFSSEATDAVPQDILQAKPGQEFTGEIINIKGNEVTIGLANNQSFNAKLEADVDLFLGQKLNFLIKSNDGNTIEIKPLYNTLSQNPAVEKALSEAGIENNLKNSSLVLEMMKEGMSINKASLQNMIRLVNANPNAKSSTIAKLVKAGIAVTPNNIEQFTNYQNCEHRIIKEMNSLTDNITNLLQELTDSGEKENAIILNNKIIDILNMAIDENTKTMATKSENILIPQNENEAENILINKNANDSENILTPKNPNDSENILIQKNANDSDGILAQKDINAAENELIQKDENKAENELVQKNNNDAHNNVISKGAENSDNIKADSLPLKEEYNLEKILNSEQRDNFAGKLKDIGINKEILQNIKDGKIDAKELINVIKDAFEKNENIPKEKVAEIITDKSYQKLLKNVIKSEWVLEPDEISKMKNFKEYYSRLNNQTKQLMEAFESIGKENSQGYKNASDLKGNLDFMNQLNQSYTYLQMPIKFTNEETHSDLYVYTNKKNLKNYDGNLSVMLHLDMEVLGITDVYIEMMPNNNIKAKFSLENSQSIEIVQDNIDKLIANLAEKGYKASATVEKMKKDMDFVEDFIEKDKVMTSMKRFSFDVRM